MIFSFEICSKFYMSFQKFECFGSFYRNTLRVQLSRYIPSRDLHKMESDFNLYSIVIGVTQGWSLASLNEMLRLNLQITTVSIPN